MAEDFSVVTNYFDLQCFLVSPLSLTMAKPCQPPRKMMRKKHDNIRLYHVDHLGSTALVTDIDGEITQHVAYIPYGEIFVEQRNGSWNTPYLFNAKELDEETGLYYYGARYLDPTHATWLSVDPLFEKGKGISPYAYCFSNPVKLQDPNGKWPWEWGEWPGVTYKFGEVEIGAGLGYGLNYVYQRGTAYDEVGKTQFKMRSVLYFGNQENHDGSKDPQIVAGFSVSINLGITQDWSHETFLGDITSYNAECGSGVGIHYIFGANFGFGEKRFTATGGVGIGIKVQVINTKLVESVSMTDEQAKYFSRLNEPYGNWIVRDSKYDEKNNKWNGSVFNGVMSVNVSCDNVVVDGQNTPSKIWMSEEYKNAALKAEKGE
jgi:RHS repeat-associated protein